MKASLVSSIERLEARIAPAGLVKISVTGGHVTLKGDASDNGITVNPIDSFALQIVGDGTTQFQLGNEAPTTGPVNVSGFTGDLKIALGAGDDALALNGLLVPRNLTVDLGGGTNTVNVNAARLLGSATFLGKSGADTVTFNGIGSHIGRNLKLSLGDGSNTFDTSGGEISIAGNFSYTGGTGQDVVRVVNNVAFTVGRSTAISTGGDFSSVNLAPLGNLYLNGNVTISTGDGSGTTEAILAPTNDLRIAGNLKVATGAGGDTVTVFPTNRLYIDGNTSINTGIGAGRVTISGTSYALSGNLTVKGSGGSDVTISSASFGIVTGALSVTGGDAEDNVFVTGYTRVSGKVSIDLGAGNNQNLDILGTASQSVFGAGLALKNANAAFDTSLTRLGALVVLHSTNVSLGQGNDELTLDDVSLFGSTNLSLGAGDDALFMETFGGFGGQSFLNGPFVATLGGGDDTVTFGGGAIDAARKVNASMVTSKVSIDGGTGANALSHLLSGNSYLLPVVTQNVVVS